MVLELFEKGINKRVEWFRLGLIRNFDKECRGLLEIVSILDNLQDSITGWKVSVGKFEELDIVLGKGNKLLLYNGLKAEVEDRKGDVDKHANDFLMNFSSVVERMKHD